MSFSSTLAEIKKALVAGAAAVAVIAAEVSKEGDPTSWSPQAWVATVVAVLSALGVYQVSNGSSSTGFDDDQLAAEQINDLLDPPTDGVHAAAIPEGA